MNLNQYLQQKIDKWVEILNQRYRTDAGQELTDHAKGRLNAYMDIRDYIKKHEK